MIGNSDHVVDPIIQNKLIAAIKAVSPSVRQAVIDGLLSLPENSETLKTDERMATLVGQAGHESQHFNKFEEILYFRTAERIQAVWPGRFHRLKDAEPYVRNPQAIANLVYANRLGNGTPGSGDGWRYRGRGPIMCTGKGNYRDFGDFCGRDLVKDPDLMMVFDLGWEFADWFLTTKSRKGKTALQYIDEGDLTSVTRIINGGTIGLDERLQLTAKALRAIRNVA